MRGEPARPSTRATTRIPDIGHRQGAIECSSCDPRGTPTHECDRLQIANHRGFVYHPARCPDRAVHARWAVPRPPRYRLAFRRTERDLCGTARRLRYPPRRALGQHPSGGHRRSAVSSEYARVCVPQVGRGKSPSPLPAGGTLFAQKTLLALRGYGARGAMLALRALLAPRTLRPCVQPPARKSTPRKLPEPARARCCRRRRWDARATCAARP